MSGLNMRHWGCFAAAVAALAMLNACGGTSTDFAGGGNKVGSRIGSVFERKTRELPPPDPALQVLGDIPYCPAAQILNGTELHRVYARGEEGLDTGIVAQSSIIEVARECAYDPSVTNVTIKVGIAGRTILGPKGAPNTFAMPLRIVVLDQDNKPLFSEPVKVSTTILPGETNAEFSHVREAINLPLARPDDVYALRIYVGFDDPNQRP